MFLWRILPQPFPAPIFIQDGEITKSRDCKTYCSVCCWGYVLAWILVLCIMGLLGSWIWILVEINYVMPHTFAWENLLRTFGSAIYMNECANDTTTVTVQSNGTSLECWTKANTIPCVPIIASLILTVTIINGVWCLLPVSLLNLYNAVLNMRANLAWHLFFFLISSTVVSTYFAMDLVELRYAMKSSIDFEIKNHSISPRWELTQTNAQCCGVDNYQDWKPPNELYPISCCKSKAGDCTKPPSAANVWKDGCFSLEYNKVALYGGLEIGLIWLTYIISLALYKLIVSLSLKQYEGARADGDITTMQENQSLDSPNPKTPLLKSD